MAGSTSSQSFCSTTVGITVDDMHPNQHMQHLGDRIPFDLECSSCHRRTYWCSIKQLMCNVMSLFAGVQDGVPVSDNGEDAAAKGTDDRPQVLATAHSGSPLRHNMQLVRVQAA